MFGTGSSFALGLVGEEDANSLPLFSLSVVVVVVGLLPNEIDANGEAVVADDAPPLPDDRKANGELADFVAAALPNPLNPLKTPVAGAAAVDSPPSALSSPPTAPLALGTRRLATLIVRCFISASDALRNSPCSSWSSSSSQLSWVSSFPGLRLADIFPMRMRSVCFCCVGVCGLRALLLFVCCVVVG